MISVPPRDAQRIVERLKKRSPESTAAAKIERAMELGSNATVELGIGEDDDVLDALDDLRAESDFGRDLDRLDRALRTEFEQEH